MAKAIMIQGTMSNVGKSFLTAGLCRIFKQDGYKVAPFKSQNIALNSYVTEEGLEIGRAQAMQAEAAGIRPTSAMNPILLKLTKDTGSQVVVRGKVLEEEKVREYYQAKNKLIPIVMEAYEELAEEYDILVIEGAGSPAEINLGKDTFVNMGMAELVKAPVLLVGDIQRGGVFAQFYGTIMLLDEEERSRIKGMIINRYCGNNKMLEPGIEKLERLTRIPMLGITPSLDIMLDEEDSLTPYFSGEQAQGLIDLAVICYPNISNFTDLAALEAVPGVSVRYVRKASEFRNPDMILLPGTKNTMSDLKWLREHHMDELLFRFQKAGTVIFGICGGYQMLGEMLSDPDGMEQGGEMKGLGLLPVSTVFDKEKTLSRVTGTFTYTSGILENLKDVELEGYEIHMGRSFYTAPVIPMITMTDQVSGKVTLDGVCRENVYGTYVHGIFDKKEVAEAMIQAIGKTKGIDMKHLKVEGFSEFKEMQYDLLAYSLRQSLDLKKIYEIMDL